MAVDECLFVAQRRRPGASTIQIPEHRFPTMNSLQCSDPPQATAQVLRDWHQADTLARAQQRSFGLWERSQIIDKSGLEIFRDVASGLLPALPIMRTLDFQIVEVAHGYIVLQARPQAGHFNPLGSAHGGWIATLLDTAAGCAVHTSLPAGKACATSNLNIHYVKGIGSDVPMVRAIGRLLHSGKTMGTSEASVVGADGKLYAHATSTVVTLSPR